MNILKVYVLGVNLRSIVPRIKISLEHLKGKSVAIDAYNALYQFLAIIRQPNGRLLTDQGGKVTSHLIGLLYRTANLFEKEIKAVYVFDGKPPALKETEIKRRTRIKEEAIVKYEKALEKGEIDEARKYAQSTSKLKAYMVEDSKRLLNLMGVPWVQAPSEGEAQAAYISKKKDTDLCASQDYDSLLFGAPKLARNITITGRRKLPGKKIYIAVQPEIIELDSVLRELGITYEQLIDVAILVGTDFNPKGVKGIGPKRALKLIKKYENLEKAMPFLKGTGSLTDLNKIREVFISPRITNEYNIEWKEPDVGGTIDFLCGERDFSKERIQRALEKMEIGLRKKKEKVTLETFFSLTDV
jgi:flap endonuclease-1